MDKILHTKFGSASLVKQGYYRIRSRKEGNYEKFLHRLIFEDFYGEIPEGYVIHHKDGNKTNNCILNLQLMKKREHCSLHNLGDNNHKVWLGKTRSKETCEKISKAMSGAKNPNYGKPRDKAIVKKQSLARNTRGFYRVLKQIGGQYKQGFIWIYRYYDEDKEKRIGSIHLKKLKEKVLSNNLPWGIINEDKAISTCEKYNYDLKELC